MSRKHTLKNRNFKHFHQNCRQHLVHFFPFIFALIAVTSGILTTANAQPRKLLGDDGALIWFVGDTRELGFFGIEDGERSMLFFSNSRSEDSRRVVYRQIYSLNGNREFESPQPISTPDMVASYGGAGKVDAEGNTYIGWFAAPPEDRTDVHLYVRKYDSDGRDLWGDGFVHRMEIDTGNGGDVNGTPSSEWIIPDELGGCYYASKFGIFAIGDDGRLREFEGQAELPNEFFQRYLYEPVFDGNGGLWLYYFDFDVGVRFWNRIRYDGSRNWDEFQRLQPEGLEGNPDVDLLIGWEGGGLCLFDRNSICLIDGDG